MTLKLITAVGDYVGVLPNMLSHYHSLGVRDFIIQAQSSSDDDTSLGDIAKIAASFGCEISSTMAKSWLESDNTFRYASPREKAPNDWFIVADQDELQAYPDDVADLIQYCDRKGYDYIEGCLVDRVTESGSLASIEAGKSIWDQFPIGALVSARVLGAVTNKVVAAKGNVKIRTGQHHARSGVGCPPSEIYVPVHHFKWVDGLPQRLQNRLTTLPGGLYTRECSRFLSYYAGEGRIRVDDPRLLAGHCTPEYPNWEVLREWRMAAPYFSCDLAIRESWGTLD